MNLGRRLLATQPHDRISPTDGGGVPLRRALGIYGLIGVGLGTMLGGIFSTIGAGANVAGAGGVLASFALTGIACVFVALCYAELSSMVPIASSAAIASTTAIASTSICECARSMPPRVKTTCATRSAWGRFTL